MQRLRRAKQMRRYQNEKEFGVLPGAPNMRSNHLRCGGWSAAGQWRVPASTNKPPQPAATPPCRAAGTFVCCGTAGWRSGKAPPPAVGNCPEVAARPAHSVPYEEYQEPDNQEDDRPAAKVDLA